MFRALSRTSTTALAVAQRQVWSLSRTQAATASAFHSSSAPQIHNSNSNSNSNTSSSSSSGSDDSGNSVSEMIAALRSNNNNATSPLTGKVSSLYGSRHSATGGNSSLSSFGRSDTTLFGLPAGKANTTSNPIHLDTNHPSEGRSFRVHSSGAIDQAYRRLRTTLNQSNMKQELRLRRHYETGHVRMRRQNQERNKKLFGAMVRKKIELIKLMKIRGM
ncbi:hypothetical protein EDD11_007219 [Mortierella claussenii]|nr:hypothetical protein EDD11_007219 [Mortierella claussenii]